MEEESVGGGYDDDSIIIVDKLTNTCYKVISIQ